jgi:hypothetical protein
MFSLQRNVFKNRYACTHWNITQRVHALKNHMALHTYIHFNVLI